MAPKSGPDRGPRRFPPAAVRPGRLPQLASEDVTADSLRRWCLARPSAVEESPFGPHTSVFKVAGKMFALTALDARPLTVSLKCEPTLAEALRAEHPAVRPGYHLNKRHWITVTLDDSLTDELVLGLIEDSYALVVDRLPKRERDLFARTRRSQDAGQGTSATLVDEHPTDERSSFCASGSEIAAMEGACSPAYCWTASRYPGPLGGVTAACGSRTGARGRSSPSISTATARSSEKTPTDWVGRRTGSRTGGRSSRAEVDPVGPDGSRVRHADLRDISRFGWSEITVDGRGNVYVNTINFDFAEFTEVLTSGSAHGKIAFVTPDGEACWVGPFHRRRPGSSRCASGCESSSRPNAAMREKVKTVGRRWSHGREARDDEYSA